MLIYPSGAENAIEVYHAIRHSVHVNVVAATAKVDHSDLVYEGAVEHLPYIHDPAFLDELNSLIDRRGIDFIFPTHDSVALFLAESRPRLKCAVIASHHDTMRVCRHKRLMYRMLGDMSSCPAVYDDIQGPVPYPIFAKPDVGEGAKGVHVVHDGREHAALRAANDDLVFVEYLPGREYTVDCFTDRHGRLLFVGPRERSEIKMGISFHSRAVEDRGAFERIAQELNNRLKFRGLWFFQVKEDGAGRLKLLEVSARVACTMGYFRHKGVNLPLLTVLDALDMDVVIKEGAYDVELFRSTLNRYRYDFDFTTVYLDLDDTVIMDGKVCTDVITFVYQCMNRGRKVHLITKHEHDVQATLRKYRIDPALFASIIMIPMTDSKADHIVPDGAIFIDNWYTERAAVQKRHGIPVFDVDAVASLIVR